MRGSRGAAWLLADGGLGLPHAPVTRDAFDNAEPMPMLDAAVADAHLAPVTAWQRRGGQAFGEAPGPGVGAYLSIVFEGYGFGIVKLLRLEFLGIHIRLYSNTFAERPVEIDEASLESRPLDLAHAMAGEPSPVPFAMRHLALSHASFARWQPEFVAMALVDPDEFLGYEEWKLAKGTYT
jgi:hypothetical protein